MESYHTIYRGRRVRIFLVSFLLAVLLAAASLFFPMEYRAEARLLITQRAAFTLDPYTALRSAELVGDNLSQVAGTSSFLEKVLKSGFSIDADYFKKDERARRKQWTKMIEAGMETGTGILDIKVYHQKIEQASQIANAVVFVLNRDGADYVGRDIGIRLIDAPLVSHYPVRPSLPLNALAGFLLGLLLAHLWYYSEHRKRRHHGQG